MVWAGLAVREEGFLMFPSSPKPLPVPSGPAAAVRLSWPDFAVVVVAVAFTVFLNLRGTPILGSVAISAGTMLVFVGIIAIPRGVGEIARNLRMLRNAAETQAWTERS
jgi:uncharacterized membrane protein HdeD (DUF308 family)